MNELSTTIMPETIDSKLKMASVFIKSGLMPRGFDTPEKLVIALELGHELGLPPLVSILNIAVINNRPTLKADMMVALALRSGMVQDLKINFVGKEHQNDSSFGCKVTLRRKGIDSPFVAQFTRRDAKIANLAHKDNWRKYERRMLKHRAIAYCIRDALPEIFSGIYLPDELQHVESDNDIEYTNSSETDNNEVTTANTSQSESSDDTQKDKPRPVKDEVTPGQITAIQELADKNFSYGIVQSYIYDQFEVNTIEELSKDVAGKIILLLQNSPDKIYKWVEQTYQQTA